MFDVLKVLDKVNDDLEKYFDLKEYIECLNIRTILRYTLQQRNQKNKKLVNEFIDSVFDYLDNEFPNWKKIKYRNKETL